MLDEPDEEPSGPDALTLLTDAWIKEIQHALQLTEDRPRIERGLPPIRHPDGVAMPTLPRQRLALLNWKVWTLRYRVSPTFILEFVLRWYASRRKRNSRALSLGLPVNLITGPGCRAHLEEEIRRTWPNGENRVDTTEPELLPEIKDGNPLREYDRIMRQRHRDAAAAPVPRRPYRK